MLHFRFEAALYYVGDRRPLQTPEAVQRLCDETGAALVISSTWRLIHKRAAIGDMFRARDLTTTILGMTAALHTARGHEIQAWLDAK